MSEKTINIQTYMYIYALQTEYRPPCQPLWTALKGSQLNYQYNNR